MEKRAEKTICSFVGFEYNVRILRVSDYRPFDRYQLIVNRRVKLTTLSEEIARIRFVREVTHIINQLKLF